MAQKLSTGGERQKTYRSISQLKQYSRCGTLYQLERLEDNIPTRPAAWTIQGIAFHDAIMEWEKSSRNVDVFSAFQESYDREVHNFKLIQPEMKYWMVPPRTKSVETSILNYRERGLTQLDTYTKRCEEASWETSYLERQFEYEASDNIIVRGAIDRILFYPFSEEYVVEDLKTGSPKDEADKRQLAFYAFVARELWDIPVTSGRYWYTKCDRPSDTFEDLEKFDKKFWDQTFKALDISIANGVFLSNPGAQCSLCSVRPWCPSQGWLQIGEKL